MSRYRTAANWSAGMLATAAAALLTASATLPGSAAHLEVDGGVLQVFVLDGPENLPGPPDGVPPGPPDGLPPGPLEGIPGGPPDGAPGGPPDGVVTGPPVAESEDPPGDESEDPSAGPQNPSDQPTDEQQQSGQGSKGEDTTAATMSAPESEVRYESCAEAHEAGAAPLESDDPGYRPELDDDGDGRACEEGEGQL